MGKLFLTLFASFITLHTSFGIEKPEFNIIQKKEPYEIRLYKPYLLAETQIKANYQDAQNNGFKKLAAYIFGENSKKQKMDMTAPVHLIKEGTKIDTQQLITLEPKETAYIIQFMIPSKFNQETLPTPKDPQIRITSKQSHKMAVISFKGNPSEDLVKQKTNDLLSFIKKEGLKPVGSEPILARYNPPFVPGFLKHNEVLIEIY